MANFATPAQRARHAFFKRLRWYSLTAGTLLLLVLVAWGFLKLPLFTGANISVTGLPDDAQSAALHEVKLSLLQMKKFAILGPDNYFSWPSDYPYSASAATSVELSKNLWGKSITLAATPRQRYAIWCSNNSDTPETCFWIDQFGVAFEKAPAGEGQLVRTIYATSHVDEQSAGKPVVSADTFVAIKKIIDGVSAESIDITHMTYDDDTQELKLTTDYGTLIRFSTRFDPTETALPALRRFVDKPGISKLDYLNLTVENRAFFKYK